MVLEDHQRRGRMLVPPMFDMPLQETRWHVERLPELFWLAFVGKRLGDRQVLELAYEMAVDVEATIKRVRKDDKAFRAYFPSEHMSCSESERKQVVADHSNAKWLRELRPHFAEMAAVWNGLPFRYLASDIDEPTDDLILEIKGILQECSHRHDKRALVIQATIVALEFRTEKMFVAQGLDIPDLNAVFDYPETEESQHAAGFVVTTCGQTILCRKGPDEAPDFSWQRSFWNVCYRLEPCEYE
ncbi:hypothetical protein M4951_10310 [Blastopirellula sp. J2-11]|uniref:hypothetical protein n=1 Tax=Blastopirellula sp. J2-11 TaxID=2943192 RepID=UPI0021C81D29|nr:hypothetical protein [Blastopirellula sp. J2-11]UUO08691.1 hypothetical protein M4951_10310 [Blastopirellula sp. J2-11]